MLHGKAYEKYQSALEEARKEHEVAVTGEFEVEAIQGKNAKIHLAFASFCEGQIRTLHSSSSGGLSAGSRHEDRSGGGGGATARGSKRQKSGGTGSWNQSRASNCQESVDLRDDVAYALQYIQHVLAAIQKGSSVAPENFPRTLELLVQMQDAPGADRLWAKASCSHSSLASCVLG